MKLHSVLAVAAISSLFASCKKENQAEENGTNVRYQLLATNTASQPGIAAQEGSTLRTTATINWTSGFANVTELKFEARSRENDISYRSRTDHRVDLFDPASTIGSLLVPSGDYRQVKFRIGLAPANNEPALELVGDYNGTPVVLYVSHPFEVKGVENNVTVTDNNGYTAITDFDLSKMLNDVPASALDNAIRVNGQILLSGSSNQNIYNKVLRNLREHEHKGRWKRN